MLLSMVCFPNASSSDSWSVYSLYGSICYQEKKRKINIENSVQNDDVSDNYFCSINTFLSSGSMYLQL